MQTSHQRSIGLPAHPLCCPCISPSPPTRCALLPLYPPPSPAACSPRSPLTLRIRTSASHVCKRRRAWSCVGKGGLAGAAPCERLYVHLEGPAAPQPQGNACQAARHCQAGGRQGMRQPLSLPSLLQRCRPHHASCRQSTLTPAAPAALINSSQRSWIAWHITNREGSG